jgi:hypothetical protein
LNQDIPHQTRSSALTDKPLSALYNFHALHLITTVVTLPPRLITAHLRRRPLRIRQLRTLRGKRPGQSPTVRWRANDFSCSMFDETRVRSLRVAGNTKKRS